MKGRTRGCLVAGLAGALIVACNGSSPCGPGNNNGSPGVDNTPSIDITVVDSVTGMPLCTASGGVTCDSGGGQEGACSVACSASGYTGTYSETITVAALGYRTGQATVSVTVTCTSGSARTTTLRLVAECSMPVIHDNGVGEKWTDCVAPYTYDQAEAMVACSFHPGAGTCSTAMDCPLVGDAGDSIAVCSAPMNTSGLCVCWNYHGAGAGHVRSSGAGCQCATEGDPYWD